MKERVCQFCAAPLPEGVSRCKYCDHVYDPHLTPVYIPDAEEIPAQGMIQAETTTVTGEENKDARFFRFVSCKDADGRVQSAVSGIASNAPNSLRMPAMDGQRMVIEVRKEAFRDNKRLTQIELPHSLKRICASAFEGCTHLQVVRGGEGLEAIEEGAFRRCIHLEHCDFEKKPGAEWAYSAFAGCYALALTDD